MLPATASQGEQLRACMRCGLAKTFAAFCEYGCENCAFMAFDDPDNRARVRSCTTSYFDGLVGMVGNEKGKVGSESWVARWQHITTYLAPGLYALSTSEELPKAMQDYCRENDKPFITPNVEGAAAAQAAAAGGGGAGGGGGGRRVRTRTSILRRWRRVMPPRRTRLSWIWTLRVCSKNRENNII